MTDDRTDDPRPSETSLSAADEGRVEETLERLKAAVRQRRAERTTVGGEREESRLRLLEVRRNEFVRDPIAVSPRPWLGRFLVFFRKATYHLLLKWHARGVLDQQNELNRAVSRLLEDLVEAQERTDERLDRLSRKLAELEAATVAQEAPGNGPGEAPEGGEGVGGPAR